MSYFGKNIRKIRSIQKISQSEFAELFDLSRASIGSYEEERAEPKIELINKVANHFSITLDELINKELTVNELYHFDVGNEPTFKTNDNNTAPIQTLPLIHSHLLLSSKTSFEKIKQTESIQIPVNTNPEQTYAISISPQRFTALPPNLQPNDVIVVNTNESTIDEKHYFLIKMENAIYISKLKLLAGNKILIKQLDNAIAILDLNKITYCYPIIKFIGSLPNESESDAIKRLEQQLSLVIEKTCL